MMTIAFGFFLRIDLSSDVIFAASRKACGNSNLQFADGQSGAGRWTFGDVSQERIGTAPDSKVEVHKGTRRLCGIRSPVSDKELV